MFFALTALDLEVLYHVNQTLFLSPALSKHTSCLVMVKKVVCFPSVFFSPLFLFPTNSLNTVGVVPNEAPPSISSSLPAPAMQPLICDLTCPLSGTAGRRNYSPAVYPDYTVPLSQHLINPLGSQILLNIIPPSNPTIPTALLTSHRRDTHR